jgi:predicted aspartyl protease
MRVFLGRGGAIALLALGAAIVPATGTGAQGGAGAGAVQVPINVISGSNHQKLVEVQVTVAGQQLPFVVDTGAANSAISLRVAKLLHLPKAGRVHRGVSAGCTPKFQPITMSGWTLGGVALPTVRMDASNLGLSGVGAVGLLGSDVLSTFDKVSIDYAHRIMTLRA